MNLLLTPIFLLLLLKLHQIQSLSISKKSIIYDGAAYVSILPYLKTGKKLSAKVGQLTYAIGYVKNGDDGKKVLAVPVGREGGDEEDDEAIVELEGGVKVYASSICQVC